MILAISLVTSAMTILMMYLLGSKRRIGFAVSLANQPLWLAIALLTGAYGLLPLQVVMTILAIRGWRNWGKA